MERGIWERRHFSVYSSMKRQDVKGEGRVMFLRILMIGSECAWIYGCSMHLSKWEVIGRMFVEQKFDVLAMSETKLKGKGKYEWKDVRCDQSESKGRSGLNGEYGSETACDGMEGSVIKADVGEGKVC